MLLLLVTSALAGVPQAVDARPEGYTVASAPLIGVWSAEGIEVPCAVGVGVAAGADRASTYTIEGCVGVEDRALDFVRKARWAAAPGSRWLVHGLMRTQVPLGPTLYTTMAALASAPPAPEAVWPEGYAGPSATCRMGAIVVDGAIAGLRAPRDCPAVLVAAAADRLRGTAAPTERVAGVEVPVVDWSWDQVFAPPGTAAGETVEYGWRAGHAPASESGRIVSKIAVETPFAFDATIMVGADGVPRGVAIDSSPGTTHVRTAPTTASPTAAAQLLRLGDTRRLEPTKVITSDPAALLMGWRLHPAPAPYTVSLSFEPAGMLSGRSGTSFDDATVMAGVPRSASAPITLPTGVRGTESLAVPTRSVELGTSGAVRLTQPPLLAAEGSEWVARVDAASPWPRPLEALAAAARLHGPDEGEDGKIWAEIDARHAGLREVVPVQVSWNPPLAQDVVVSWWEGRPVSGGVSVGRGRIGGWTGYRRPIYVVPQDGQAWSEVVAMIAQINQSGDDAILAPRGPRASGPPAVADSTDAPREVQWRQVTVKKRVMPKTPKDLPDTEVHCVVRATIDARGVPTSVTAKSCPDSVFPAAEKAMMASRFYPSMQDGKAVPATFAMVYIFRRK